VIERVFQLPFTSVFEEFDPTPIGTGAIAQVYKAILKSDLLPPSYLGPRRNRGSSMPNISPVILQDPDLSVPTASVAIKVLHPGVEKMIHRDLSIMSFFARCLSFFPGVQWLSLPEEVQVFGGMMFQQLDLRNEAENLITFEDNFKERRVPVTFPRPLKVWSTKEMLMEEYLNALPLEIFLKNGGGPYDQQLATVGLGAFLNMLLLDNFVHADLHPGNIMIKFSKPASTKTLLQNLLHGFTSKLFGSGHKATSWFPPAPPDYGESDAIVTKLRARSASRAEWLDELDDLFKTGYIPEIVFIDAGLTTTLSSHNRTNFLDLFRSIAEFDGYTAGKLMVERSRTPELALDPETFALRMQHLVLSVKRKTFSLGQIRISDVLRDVLWMVRKHRVKMEADFVNTVISVLLLEGIGRQLDPQLDLFKSALPILRQLGGQMAKETAQAAAREGNLKTPLPSSDLGAMLKVWVWLEARDLVNASVVNADDMVKYGWLSPSI
jgi:aarF domain-containing kinase